MNECHRMKYKLIMYQSPLKYIKYWKPQIPRVKRRRMPPHNVIRGTSNLHQEVSLCPGSEKIMSLLCTLVPPLCEQPRILHWSAAEEIMSLLCSLLPPLCEQPRIMCWSASLLGPAVLVATLAILLVVVLTVLLQLRRWRWVPLNRRIACYVVVQTTE
jgi:hypothetical protein